MRGLLLASCLAGASVVGTAHAQTAAHVESETLILRGLKLRRQRNDEGALAAFRQAYAANATPRALAQVALAEQALGRWLDAERDLSEAMAQGDDGWIRSNRIHLQNALSAIQEHLASLVVTCNVTGADLWVDGKRIGPLGASPVRVVAGTSVIEVRAPGYETSRRAIVVPPSATWKEEVRLSRLPGAVPPPPPDVTPHSEAPAHASRGDTQRTVGFVGGALGAASLGAGGVFALFASKAKNEYMQHCGSNIGEPPGVCDEAGIQGHDDASSKAFLSTVFVASGAILTVAGAVLFFSAPRRGLSAQVGVGPTGVAIEGRF